MIYSSNQKAILYRPSTNKIIEVAPINLEQKQAQATTTKTPTPSPKELTLTVYNASNISGLASTTKQKIEGKFSQMKVVGTGNAKEDYSKTVVYDLTGKNKALVTQLAQFLSGDVGINLPSGETKPSTDLLVVVVE